jgi:pilus assembly protein CpaF
VRVTVHFLDGEQIEGDSDALSLEKIGFPLRVAGDGNSRNVYVSVAAIKYVAINPVAGDRTREGDPRVSLGLPKAVLHFVDGDTMHTYKDEYFGQQAEGYNARIWDPRARALLRVMVSMHALKGVFFVDSFDSRTESDKRDDATRLRQPGSRQVPTDWIKADPAPDIDPELRRLARAYQRRLALEPDLEPGADPIHFEKAIRNRLDRLLEEDLVALRPEQKNQLVGLILRDAIGFGPLDPLLKDPSISEIMVNAADEVYIERSGQMLRSQVHFEDIAQLMNVIRRMVASIGRRIDESSPMVDARLPDGSRLNAVIPPAATRGPALTIRKFRAFQMGLDDLIAEGTLSPAMASFLQRAVEGRLSILISGGTGSGKTTTMNVLGALIPPRERVVTIEDSAELQLTHSNVVALEYRPPNVEGKGELSIRQLLRNSLRMRPDRVLVGEVRDGAALDMLQAMNTGHDGSMSTIHANSARDAFSRLETMVLSGSVDLPLPAVRAQIASAINLVVQQGRLPDGTRKILQIAEVRGYEGDVPLLDDIFRLYRSPEGAYTFEPTGVVPQAVTKMAFHGVRVEPAIFTSQPHEVTPREAADPLPPGEATAAMTPEAALAAADEAAAVEAPVPITPETFDPLLTEDGDGAPAARPDPGHHPTSVGSLLRRRQAPPPKPEEDPPG